MLLFEWKGPEYELVPGCHCIHFTIESIDGAEGERVARGRITGKDYIEHGIEFNDPWVAEELVLNETSQWVVSRPKEGDKFCWVGADGAALFTANTAVNEAMEAFVATQIEFFLRTGQALVEAQRYTGPRKLYAGHCLCIQLMATQEGQVFDWQEATGGKFPKRCFACSCGRKWWCANTGTGLWLPVADPLAWEVLLDYDGEPTAALGEVDGNIELLQTLRERGFIPIG